MSRNSSSRSRPAKVLAGAFGRNLHARRLLSLELPEFLICALEARVAEANAEAEGDDHATLNNYVECELVNLVTVRDIAELDLALPGFAEAVNRWLFDLRE
jgi:hypothetical protein